MKTFSTLTIAVLAAAMTLVQAAPLNKASAVARRQDGTAYANSQWYDQQLAQEEADELREGSSNKREADNQAYENSQWYDQLLAQEESNELREGSNNKREADNQAYENSQWYDQLLAQEESNELKEGSSNKREADDSPSELVEVGSGLFSYTVAVPVEHAQAGPHRPGNEITGPTNM